MPTFQTRDNTGIYFKDWGTGRAVVFSHGRPLSGDARRRSILSILALCAVVSLVAATADAQELAASTSKRRRTCERVVVTHKGEIRNSATAPD